MPNDKRQEEVKKIALDIMTKAQEQFHIDFPGCALPDSLRPDIESALLNFASKERDAVIEECIIVINPFVGEIIDMQTGLRENPGLDAQNALRSLRDGGK